MASIKEKVKAAPKELVRRGLDDGTERLCGQLRETAQRGQASDYGGDQIEDTAARGAYQARRGVETLLKKKKSARNRLPDEEPRTPDPSTPPEAPSDPPAPSEPPARKQPRIKTRETVSASEGGAGVGPTESGGTGPSSGERMRQARIKTREPAVHDLRPDVPPASQGGLEPPQVRTRDAASGASTGHRTAAPSSGHNQPSHRLSIKTKGTYIQGRPASAPEQPPQALVQGTQEFMRERGRTAAIKRAEAQREGNDTIPQAGNGGETAPPAPMRRGYTGGQGRYAPAQAVRGPGEPDPRPVRDGGRKIVKTARSGRKAAQRTAKQTIKTAERSSQKAVKTAQRAAKTAQQTVKTAQATVKATQRAIQTARATAKAAAKATVTAIKAAIATMQELIAAIAAGGWVVLVVVLVICMIGLLIASPFGIFFADGSSPDAVSPTAAIVQINSEYGQ